MDTRAHLRVYRMMVLCDAANISYGYGVRKPFRILKRFS
jgi:uncharacterized protein YbbC (DUF1343 family)